MPRTVRPFSDRARPDPRGNVLPYDAPADATVLQADLPGGLPVELTNPADLELVPFTIGGVRTVIGDASGTTAPEVLFPANPRRGALTVYPSAGAGARWRVGRSAADVLRDDTSVIYTTAGFPLPVLLRVSWTDAVWVAQAAGDANARLSAISEDWAR